jgi:enamine deaminase RidA (YjgF/YER057c/UK114 family)
MTHVGATRQAIGVDQVWPYSKVIKAGGFVFVKSHIGTGASGDYPEDVGSQTRNTLVNLESTLKTASATLDDVMKVNVFLPHIDKDFDEFDAAYREFFRDRGVAEMPARTTIGAPLSWPQLRVQMDVIAVG